MDSIGNDADTYRLAHLAGSKKHSRPEIAVLFSHNDENVVVLE